MTRDNSPSSSGSFADAPLPVQEVICTDALVSQPTKLYKRRWVMLLIFCSFSFCNAYQWIHLNIIGNVLISYYNQSLPEDPSDKQFAIDWLSVCFMAVYIPLIFPATYLLNRKGLYFCCIIGSSLNAIAGWIKAAAVSPDKFWLLFAGQVVAAIAQMFVLEIPPHLAGIWFGENEVSTATALGVFGNQVGIAVGFLVPPVMVKDNDDSDVTGNQLHNMLVLTATVSTVVFFIVLLLFREKPPLPPCLSTRAKGDAEESLSTASGFVNSLRRLFNNFGFVLLTLTYGVNTGSFYAISTLLNPIILDYFPGEEENAGGIGLTLVLAGILGSVLGGIILDRTRAFKITTVGFYAFSTVGMLAFTIFLEFIPTIWIIYVAGGLLGFFMTGYLPVGFEFAAELTYPEPEGTSSGMLNAAAQVFGIALTLGTSKIITNISTLFGNGLVSGALLVGCAGTMLIKSDLRRQKANKHFATVASNLNTLGGTESLSPVEVTNQQKRADVRHTGFIIG